jgi:hypothetical protein
MFVTCAALCGGHAQAALVSYDSDASFVANASFVKVGGANARWGNGAINGDWEYAVVNAADAPVPPTSDSQGQLAWGSVSGYPSGSTTQANLRFTYSFTSTGLQSFSLRNVNGNSIGSISTATGTVPVPEGGINALAIRARADAGDVAVVGPGGNDAGLRVNFTSGGFFDIGRLVGDGNAEYFVLTDTRLAGGFSIEDTATLRDGSGSLPMWQFKVGQVPVPAAMPMFVIGMAALGWFGTRRRRAEVA